MALKTDYKDYIPPSTGKKYQLVVDSSGLYSINDSTNYEQVGDKFGAADINATNEVVNGVTNGANSTATHSNSVVAITAPAGVNLISFYAPSDFSGDDTYTVNGSAVTLTDLNGNAIYDGWKEGAPVQLILKGTQAFFKSGGGVNDTLPPLNPNMTGELADGVFTVTADKLPVAQADALAGAEWYYGDHVPARPGDGTKVEFTREQLITSAPEGKAASARPAFTIPPTALFDPDTNELIEDATAGVQTLAATTNLGDETEGSIVTLLESGAPTQFYVSKQNYQNDINGNGRVLLVRKDVYDLRAWAADNITTYADSDIDAWFNGEYKSKFSPYIQDKIGSTKFYYTIGNGNNSVVQLERSVFALSLTEFGITSEYANVEGVALPNAEDLRIVYLTGSPQLQWTRSPAISNITNVFRLSKSGAESNANPNNSSGSRPCFTLPADMQVNADGSIVESDTPQPFVTLSIPWSSSGYCYCRQFPYNAKHQYQTQLVGAVATNDPIYGISLDPVLENNSWAKIAEVSETGAAANVWQVGDTKDIVVGGETLTVEIVGFDHDDLADGSGKAGITFGLKNLMTNTRQMNSTNTNAGGFTGSDMYDWLQSTLLNSLPSDLRAVLKSVNKKTSAGNQSSTINTNAMKIFLFSEIEIFGSVAFSKSGEGSQYARFATASSRIKRRSNGSGAANWWWERSPRSGSSNYFCRVTNDGNVGNVNAGAAGGVAFGFCV